MPKTIIFDPESTSKNNSSITSLPIEVPLLGEGFNHLYQSWCKFLGFMVNPIQHDEADFSNIHDLVNFSLSELSVAEENNRNYLIQLNALEKEIERTEGPGPASHQIRNESNRWGMRYCKVDMLVTHLGQNNRLAEIIESNKLLGKSKIYTEIKLLPDVLMKAIALTELAKANEMANKGKISEMVDSLYEASRAQSISSQNWSYRMSGKDAKAEKSDNGKKGASIRADKFEVIKAYVIELANPLTDESANKIAHKIKDLVMMKARSLNAPLSEENAQKTIQKYILEHRKKSF